MTAIVQEKSTSSRGYLIALTSAGVLATTAIIIRYLTQTYHLPPLVLSFWRSTFVVLTLRVILGWRRPELLRLPRQHFGFLLVYGFVLAIFNSTWTFSVSLIGASVATVLVYSSGIFTVLLGWWLLKERLDWVKALAVVISFVGCFLVAEAFDPTAWMANIWGIALGITSGLCYAVYTLLGRSAAQRAINPWTTLFYIFAFAWVWLLVVNLLPGQIIPGTADQIIDLFWLGKQYSGWLVLFLLAAGPTLGGYGLYNISLGYLPASVANLILMLEPPFTALIAYLFLGEIMSSYQIMGSLLIMTAVVFLRLNNRRRKS